MRVTAYRYRHRYPDDLRWRKRDYHKLCAFADFTHPTDARYLCEYELRVHVGTLKTNVRGDTERQYGARIVMVALDVKVSPDAVHGRYDKPYRYAEVHRTLAYSWLGVRSALGEDGWWRALQLSVMELRERPDEEFVRGARVPSVVWATDRVEDAPDLDWRTLHNMARLATRGMPPAALIDWFREAQPVAESLFAAPPLPPEATRESAAR